MFIWFFFHLEVEIIMVAFIVQQGPMKQIVFYKEKLFWCVKLFAVFFISITRESFLN